MITQDLLSKIFTKTSSDILNLYLPHLESYTNFRQINSPLRECAFLAQVGHESAEFHTVVENLNYSAEGLHATWSSRFPTVESAIPYARQPEKIANFVYANKNGNGSEASGDGWKYRGRGLIQITGAANYKDFGRLVEPSYLETPQGAVESACWFWDKHSLNTSADTKDMLTITKKINGGLNGYDDRMRLYNLALKAYGIYE